MLAICYHVPAHSSPVESSQRPLLCICVCIWVLPVCRCPWRPWALHPQDHLALVAVVCHTHSNFSCPFASVVMSTSLNLNSVLRLLLGLSVYLLFFLVLLLPIPLSLYDRISIFFYRLILSVLQKTESIPSVTNCVLGSMVSIQWGVEPGKREGIEFLERIKWEHNVCQLWVRKSGNNAQHLSPPALLILVDIWQWPEPNPQPGSKGCQCHLWRHHFLDQCTWGCERGLRL